MMSKENRYNTKKSVSAARHSVLASHFVQSTSDTESPAKRRLRTATFKRLSYAIVFVTLASTATLFGQQSQPFTQYLFSRFLLNPAACGAEGYASLGLTVKNQWAGFEGAPTNQTFTAQTRLSREGIFGKGFPFRVPGHSPENVGLGFTMYNDIRGLIRTTGGSFTYAYHLETETGQLSFGLTASFSQLYVDRAKIITHDPDKYIETNRLSSFFPEAAFGAHYTARDYYIGLSASNLFQSALTFGGRYSDDYKLERQYLFLGGYILEIRLSIA